MQKQPWDRADCDNHIKDSNNIWWDSDGKKFWSELIKSTIDGMCTSCENQGNQLINVEQNKQWIE